LKVGNVWNDSHLNFSQKAMHGQNTEQVGCKWWWIPHFRSISYGM